MVGDPGARHRDRGPAALAAHQARDAGLAHEALHALAADADHVRAVEWWEHPAFSDRVGLAAGELVAFDVLEPALRSRGGIPGEARERATDDAFRAEMVALFNGPPTGRLVLPSFAALAERVEELERRLDRLESPIMTG